MTSGLIQVSSGQRSGPEPEACDLGHEVALGRISVTGMVERAARPPAVVGSAWRIAAGRVVTLPDPLQCNRHGCEIAICY